MKSKSCFFGHREATEELLPQLIQTIKQHIQFFGVTEFVVGNYGGFDRLVVNAVRTVKRDHPDIMLSLLLPYHPAQQPVEKPDGVDMLFYPPGMENVPPRFAIVRANKYMIDHVDYIIAYVWHPAGNSTKLLAQARKREQKGMVRITLLEN